MYDYFVPDNLANEAVSLNNELRNNLPTGPGMYELLDALLEERARYSPQVKLHNFDSGKGKNRSRNQGRYDKKGTMLDILASASNYGDLSSFEKDISSLSNDFLLSLKNKFGSNLSFSPLQDNNQSGEASLSVVKFKGGKLDGTRLILKNDTGVLRFFSNHEDYETFIKNNKSSSGKRTGYGGHYIMTKDSFLQKTRMFCSMFVAFLLDSNPLWIGKSGHQKKVNS